MAAPEELERRHSDQEPAAGRRAPHVLRQQADIVVDVLEHVHQQYEIGIEPFDGPPKVDGLAGRLLVGIVGVARIDTPRFRCLRAFQQVLREKAGPCPDVEDPVRARPAEEPSDRARLRRVVPVIAYPRTQYVDFLQVHGASP